MSVIEGEKEMNRRNSLLGHTELAHSGSLESSINYEPKTTTSEDKAVESPCKKINHLRLPITTPGLSEKKRACS